MQKTNVFPTKNARDSRPVVVTITRTIHGMWVSVQLTATKMQI